MQLPLFYEPLINDGMGLVDLSEETHKHAVLVLRMKEGAELLLTNGLGLMARAKLVSIHKKNSTVHILACQYLPLAEKRHAIAISLLKNTNRLEWFLEKATELGISEIFLLQCERTEKQHVRMDRLSGVLVAAMLQSRQAWLPSLHAATNVHTAITAVKNYTHKLIAHCVDTPKVPLANFQKKGSTVVFIGPEGDFAADEIHEATNNHFEEISLGNTRLRTETAGVVAATLLVHC